MENEEMEMIAKNERPEMPSEMEGGESMGGFQGNGGGFPGEMTTGTVATTETNEWLVPMTATGIISGAIVLAAAAICVTMVILKKRGREN